MSTFHSSYAGIGDMLTAEFMQAEMRRRAEKVKAAAEATAPDAPPYGVGYKYEFEVESGIRAELTRRAYGRVRNRSRHAMWVEFGGRNTPKYRTLGRALDAAKD